MMYSFEGDIFENAFKTRNIEEFLELVFPPTWKGLAARIIETGVTFSNDMCAWAPRWSKIPPTVRFGESDYETCVKSCIYRVHDCLHQLWGCPMPSEKMDSNDFFEFKRATMCGEVAVLTLTEFAFADYWYNNESYSNNHLIKNILWKRNALPMFYGPLIGKSILQVAQRLDELLHKGTFPRWVRQFKPAIDFDDDYVPMLEQDRMNINHNWGLMTELDWRPIGIPNQRYSPNLDGLELTQWMINDFYHLMDTDKVVDEALRDFNRQRREGIVLPVGWNEVILNIFSVTALFIHDGLVLAVSRKNNHANFGLIGGKIDQGESPVDAIKREVKEETGLDILEMSVCFEDLDRVEEGVNKPCRCFRVTKWKGEPKSMEAGLVKWVTPQVLTNSKTSLFYKYNRNLFSALGIDWR